MESLPTLTTTTSRPTPQRSFDCMPAFDFRLVEEDLDDVHL